MNCIDIQEALSCWVDRELDDFQVKKLDSHMENCPDCSNFFKDLKTIRQSTQLLDPIEPPQKIWQDLQLQLLTEGYIEPGSQDSFWIRYLPKGFVPLKPAWGNAILGLFLIGSSFLFYEWLTEPRVEPDFTVSMSHEEVLLKELKKAESNYQMAIDALRLGSQRRLENLDPTLAQVFNDNLATMDYYLNEYKQAVKNSPQNPLAHRYLLAGYQKKIELMQTILTSDSLL